LKAHCGSGKELVRNDALQFGKLKSKEKVTCLFSVFAVFYEND